jgi:endonuclease/exonuclease/phosphatase family metal-dependent hydrolase
MTPRLILRIAACLLVVHGAGCERAPVTGPPKAVPVADDGKLRLRLMTFNVRHENPQDDGARAWPRRIHHVVRMIRTERPDVFGVQEALHGQAADLRASLPDYDFSGAGRDDGHRGGEYTAIFFRRDRFEPDAAGQGVFWLSDTPEKPGSKTWGNSLPRTAIWLRLVDRSTGRGFSIYNTHWDHRHQGSRERSAQLIAGHIRKRAAAGEPVVLLGDFNAVEQNPGLATLRRETELIDTYQALHPRETARTTLHVWRGSRAGRLKVDHILVSKNAAVTGAAIRDQDQPMVSDHFPVTAEVVFP